MSCRCGKRRWSEADMIYSVFIVILLVGAMAAQEFVPVMDFAHWPAYFEYHHPNADSGKQSSIAYGGEGWRSEFSSASAPLVPGSDRFTLDVCGIEGAAAIGASTVPSGAKRLTA